MEQKSFCSNQSKVRMLEDFRNSLKSKLDEHMMKLTSLYQQCDSKISYFIEEFKKVNLRFEKTPFCNEFCILCYDKGEISLNSCNYHKICSQCKTFNLRFNLSCHHCKSSVKITKCKIPMCRCSIPNFHSFLSFLNTKPISCIFPNLEALPEDFKPLLLLFETLSSPWQAAEEEKVESSGSSAIKTLKSNSNYPKLKNAKSEKPVKLEASNQSSNFSKPKINLKLLPNPRKSKP